MKTCILYPIDKILNALPSWRIVEVNVKYYDEDSGDYTKRETRITNQPEIIGISSSWCFGRADRVYFKDAEGNEKLAESMKYSDDDTNPNRIKARDVISPKVKVVDETFIEMNNEIKAWLEYQKVNLSEISKYAKEITLYYDITYTGVPDVSIYQHEGCKPYFGYSSNDLVLNEKEIETALNSIDDILLREKIKCILEARVFKKRY